MLKLFRLLRRQEWLMICASLVFVVGQVGLNLTMPGYMSAITALVETPGSQMSEILLNGAMMLLCAVGSMGCSVATGFFAARIGAGYGRTLRDRVFKKVLTFNNEEIGKFSTASLITRTTNDITRVQMIVAMGLQTIVMAPIMMVWAIAKIAGKQWQWSVATGIVVELILVMLVLIVILVMPKFRIIQRLTDALNRVTRENLNGIRVVRAYNAEDYQEQKFEKANKELTDTNLFTNRVMAVMMPMMTLLSSGITLAIYWIGAYLITAADQLNRLEIFSDMVVFTSYAMQVIMAFTLLAMIFIMLPRVMVSVRRINEVLDTEVQMKNGTETKDDGQKGELEFRHVNFRYPGASDDVLQDINFSVRPGQTTAIIGATASGKSSLINLIPRFYDVSGGQVLVDGVDVRDYDMAVLRDKIGYISQRAVMFSGTVESNVAYGQEDINEDRTWEALKTAQADDFVKEMDGELEAPVAQGGTNVSGGQKQRLSIARAVYKDPEIYIFDDSFSALDYKTDKALRQALDEETHASTKLIVAQRIGTIRNADQIIVLADGQVAGIGTHDELMQDCDEYREIALSQLSEEELNYGTGK